MTKEGEVLKRDVLGRVKTAKERREVILDEFERSGLSGSKFATLVGVNYQTFASWAQRRRRERKQYPAQGKISPKPVPQVRWLEAVLEQPECRASRSVLMIRLPGGAAMEVADCVQAGLAAATLRALEQNAPKTC